jgi:hypothetical protein
MRELIFAIFALALTFAAFAAFLPFVKRPKNPQQFIVKNDELYEYDCESKQYHPWKSSGPMRIGRAAGDEADGPWPPTALWQYRKKFRAAPRAR